MNNMNSSQLKHLSVNEQGHLFLEKGNILKVTHREKAISNKLPSLTKSINVGIWVVGTINQLFMRGS